MTEKDFCLQSFSWEYCQKIEKTESQEDCPDHWNSAKNIITKCW